jgi:hypothetical protein
VIRGDLIFFIGVGLFIEPLSLGVILADKPPQIPVAVCYLALLYFLGYPLLPWIILRFRHRLPPTHPKL